MALDKIDDSTATVAGARLKQYIERVERLEEERKALGADVKHVFIEAKSAGFDVKALRKVIAMRKKSNQERKEEDELVELYKAAIGME